MPEHLITSFRGGISDENAVGIRGAFKFGYGLDIHKRQDSLSCNQAMQTVFKPSDLIKFFVKGSDGTTYAFGDGGTIYTRAGTPEEAGKWTAQYNDSNGNIKGAAWWKLNTGANYIVWATGSSVARKQLVTGNSGNDFGNVSQNYKTTLTKTDWHTMKIAMGLLCIANDLDLATYSYQDEFDPAAMTLPPGGVIKCLDKRDSYVVMGSGSQESQLWSWRVDALNYVQNKDIPIQGGINSLIEGEQLLLQAGDDGELYYSDFTNKIPLLAIPGGGQTNPGGVALKKGLSLFGFYGGDYPGIWSYGRQAKNRSQVLNYEYRLAKTALGSTVTEIGAMILIDGQLLVSWKTTDGSTVEYGVDQSSSTTKAFAIYEGLEFSNKNPANKKQYKSVFLKMTALPSGSSVAMRYKMDKGSWTYAVTGGGTTTHTVANSVEAEFYLPDEGGICEVAVELTPTGNNTPEILAISTRLGNEIKDH